MSQNNDTVHAHRDHERAEFNRVVGDISDPVLLILRVHLYTEHLLERFVSCQLPRGDRLMGDGNLTYFQKLSLAASFDFIGDSYIASLRQLNHVRNRCAHELHREITIADIDRIGRPFGAEYTRIRKENVGKNLDTLMRVFVKLCAGLGATTHVAEEQAHVEETEET